MKKDEAQGRANIPLKLELLLAIIEVNSSRCYQMFQIEIRGIGMRSKNSVLERTSIKKNGSKLENKFRNLFQVACSAFQLHVLPKFGQ